MIKIASSKQQAASRNSDPASCLLLLPPRSRGYTLIELVVAVGLFALVMTLASGAYLLMIDLNRQSQGIATGVNSLSFALETMTRSIRTGSSYSCGAFGGDCAGGEESFTFKDMNGANITYSRGLQSVDSSVGAIVKTDTNNGAVTFTDPSIHISSLKFYVAGTTQGDDYQPYVTIIVSGTVSSGPRNAPQSFTIETGAAMRGIDLTVTQQAPI